jgi:hypothetical protein
MIYHTVMLTETDGEWAVSFAKSETDREETKTVPNPQGWYHYPITETKKDAASKLIICVAEAHMEEMHRLDKSMQGLKTLALRVASGGVDGFVPR